MTPEDRLDEAAKQIVLAKESDRLTVAEKERLIDSYRTVQATVTSLEKTRDDDDDAEVIR